ncbi:3-oxoacid CoA-transferase subunit B [Rummeliibacillus sp. JY-2-4R]
MNEVDNKQSLHRIRIAKRIAKELHPGAVTNLGVGIPSLIQNYLKKDNAVFLQSENGLLGMGPTPPKEDIDMNLISASKQPITLEVGASIFSSSDSFAMIRGGHVDIAVMGALQISEKGEIANWAVPGKDILGVGGAMDLVASAKKIIIAMTHVSKNGASKIIRKLTYPQSGIRTADLIVTEKAVFKNENGILVLTEIAKDTTLEEIKVITDANYIISGDLQTMKVE